MPKVKVNCGYCDKEFKVNPCRVNKESNNYCCYDHYVKDRKDKVSAWKNHSHLFDKKTINEVK